MPIRVMVVDDHPIVVDGLERLLSAGSDFEVVGRAGTAAEGRRLVESLDPDVLVLDLALPDENGLNVLRTLNFAPRPAVVVLTASDEMEELLNAVSFGARGVVLKAMAPRILEECIREVYAGRLWLRVEGVDLAERLAHRREIERELSSRLTPREIEIVRLTAAELDNDAIAAALDITIGTAKIHLHHIYDKLAVTGRRDLLEYLRARGY